ALAAERKPITGVELVAAERPVSEWLRPVIGKPGTFRIEGVGRDLSADVGVVKSASTGDRDVELVPFYRLHRRTYAAYWDFFTPPEYEKRTAERAAERERLPRLEQATVAFIVPGEGQAERDVNQQGEDTSIVRADGRPGRR